MGKRGGYRRKPPLYALNFVPDEEGAENEFDGLEVMARSLPLHEFLGLQRQQQAAQEGDPEAAEVIIRRLAGVIVSWNLEDDEGRPVPVAYAVCRDGGKPGSPGEPCSAHQGDGAAPCDYTGLVAYDMPFVLAVFYAWMNAVTSVPNLSKNDSNGGGTSQELSIPMEVA